jgi:hypothetical protein
MFRQVKQSDIEAIKLLFRSHPNKNEFINSQCKKYQLTSDFMSEFGSYVSKESFSESPLLTYSLIKQYRDKFDLALWIKSITKSMEPLLNDAFVSEISTEILNDAIINSNKDMLSKELYNKHSKVLNTNIKKIFVNSTKLSNEEEFLLANLELVDSTLFLNKQLELVFSNSLIEKILTNKKLITFSFMTELLTTTNDIAFVKRMLETKLDMQPTGETSDYVMKNFINKFPDMYMSIFFQAASTYSPNSLSYDVMDHLLKTKENLSEEFLLENINLFKSTGMIPELAKYSREREYSSVLINLRLSA